MATWLIGGSLLVLLLLAAKQTISNFSGGKCSGCPGGCSGKSCCAPGIASIDQRGLCKQGRDDSV